MPRTAWKTALEQIGEQFARHAASPNADLWHGGIVACDTDGVDVGEAIQHHEPKACRPMLARTYTHWAKGDATLNGWFFGDPGCLEPFCGAAHSAFHALLQSPLKRVSELVEVPHPPRDYSTCWLGIVYHLAWGETNPLLRATTRGCTIMPGWSGEEGTPVHFTYAFLEADVYVHHAAFLLRSSHLINIVRLPFEEPGPTTRRRKRSTRDSRGSSAAWHGLSQTLRPKAPGPIPAAARYRVCRGLGSPDVPRASFSASAS
jgi:hypothetical protein